MPLNLYSLRTSLHFLARRRIVFSILLLCQVWPTAIYADTSPPGSAYDLRATDGDRFHPLQVHQAQDGDPEIAVALAEFAGFERNPQGAAAPISAKALVNNAAVKNNLLPGSTDNYVVLRQVAPRDVGEGDEEGLTPDNLDERASQAGDANEDILSGKQNVEERQTTAAGPNPRTVYVSINTCLQPTFRSKKLEGKPPQLVLTVSTTGQDKLPGLKSTGASIIQRPLTEGWAMVEVRAVGNVYIGVSAHDAAIHKNTVWNYELAASFDEPYHTFGNVNTYLYLIDSDTQSALLVTRNLTAARPDSLSNKEWLKTGPPLSIFASNVNDTTIKGLSYSFCGLQQNAQISGNKLAPLNNGVELGLTTQSGPSLEEQFYVPGLNSTSTYYGYLVRAGNGTAVGAVPGGGGGVVTYMNFTTKRDANCQLLFNLSFCDTVAYAAPANPSTYASPAALAALYDNSTQAKYRNFNYSLQQVPCNASDSAKYSLAKTCDDCAAAYKTWLCAVSIPRCADWSARITARPSDAFFSDDTQPAGNASSGPSAAAAGGVSHLQPRNVAQKPIAAAPHIEPVTDAVELNWLATNSSRNNATIAGLVQPGPYLEILPCEDLCYELVRACPASFGFGCPRRGKGLEASYGRRGFVAGGGVSCSEPGAVWKFSAAPRLRGRLGVVVGVFVGVAAVLALG